MLVIAVVKIAKHKSIIEIKKGVSCITGLKVHKLKRTRFIVRPTIA